MEGEGQSGKTIRCPRIPIRLLDLAGKRERIISIIMADHIIAVVNFEISRNPPTPKYEA